MAPALVAPVLVLLAFNPPAWAAPAGGERLMWPFRRRPDAQKGRVKEII